ncbi:sigma-70 family RNA polymerase sigma factor [Uliginosibacterium sp. H1]|uniref:sigma-70 family RNA polymerase sigma factor n=1 Tax=Uliginosibacterium sp. H1 TaxID=3114757 RepID=UPI002E17661B|nr:sigma-70 family RNA polymerase sigma factor [Uliginosibacterium sp. H1]
MSDFHADAFDHDAALQACARGDQQALQRLYEREHRYLFGVALRIVRQRQVAEDVLHDAFVSIWQRAASFDPARGAGRGWMFTVVRHAALNRMRSASREVSLDDDEVPSDGEGGLPAGDAMTDDPFVHRAMLGRLGDCLSALEPARRDCVLLAYVEGCSHGEIAERTRTPLGTVKAWIQRSLRALRECMG